MDINQRELYANQDECLLAIADGKPIDMIIRRLSPWRAVLIARVALKAGVMTPEEVDLLMAKAKILMKKKRDASDQMLKSLDKLDEEYSE